MATSPTVGTRYINSASTYKKCETLARTNPSLASFAANLFGVGAASPTGTTLTAQVGSVQDQVNSLDKYSRNIIQGLFSVELLMSEGIGSLTESTASGIAGAGDIIHEGVRGVKEQVGEILKPISTAVGSTLGTLTNVLKDPLGAPFALPNTLMAVIDKVSPKFANTIDATVKKLGLDELANLPSQIFGSLRSLASLVDSILAVPLSLIQDLYLGLMQIMNAISDLLDSIISSIFDFFFGPGGVLDSILPIAAILELVNTVSELAAEIGSLANIFGGGLYVNQYLGMLQGFTSQITSVLSNPQSLLMSYLPPDINQYTSILRNPQQLIDQIVPPEILGQLSQIGQIPGLGFVGNSGYGLEGVLSTLKPGIVGRILDNFQGQLGVLAPVLNTGTGGSSITNTQQAFPPSVNPASTNSRVPVVQGVPVQLNPPPEILQRKNATQPSLATLLQTRGPN